MNLNGKVTIVTGGSRGLGKAIAMSLSKEGARIAVAARTEVDNKTCMERYIRRLRR